MTEVKTVTGEEAVQLMEELNETREEQIRELRLTENLIALVFASLQMQEVLGEVKEESKSEREEEVMHAE